MKRTKYSALCSVGLVLLAPGLALAQTLVFDNSAGAVQNISPRQAGSAPLTQISVGASSITITNIAVHIDLTAAANLKFLIFDGTAPGSSSLLYSSTSKSFGIGNDQWAMSDTFSYTLNANTTYYIGGISDVSAFWYTDTTADSQNGISSVIPNGNVNNFATPVRANNGATADSHIQLFTGAAVAMPEPGSLALLSLGIGGAGLMLRRRKTA